MAILFKNAITLEVKIQHYLDNVTNSGILFQEGIDDYLNGDMTQFANKLADIRQNEETADELRREIRYRLYRKMLIPESRGDVLGLLETTDNVIDATKKVLGQFDVEKPNIREFLRPILAKLAKASADALDNVVRADRAFFTNKESVEDYIHKVHFYEHEADQLEEQAKKAIFDSTEIERLSEKLQLRDFVQLIASLSDEAEDVAERLSVYAIKRQP
jgi:predicted phosphate transport protein (TIGR00153 family)